MVHASPAKEDGYFIDISTELGDVDEFYGTIPYQSHWSLLPFLERQHGLSEKELAWLQQVEQTLQEANVKQLASESPLQHEDLVKLVRLFFPPFKKGFELGALSRPLAPKEIFATPSWYKLLVCGDLSLSRPMYQAFSTVRAGMLILNQHYNQTLQEAFNKIVNYRHAETGIVTHYRIHSDFDYVTVDVHGEKPYLRRATIRQLLSNLDDTELWLKTLPPANFSFRGLEVHQIIDDSVEVSKGRLQQLLLKREAVLSPERIQELRNTLRNYFKVPDLHVGIMALDFPTTNAVGHRYLIRQDLLADKIKEVLDPAYGYSIYRETCEQGKVKIYDDLRDCRDENGELENLVLAAGYKSIVLVPLFGKGDHIIGLLELSSKRAYAFNNLVIYQLEEIAPLFRQALRRSRNDMEAKIQTVMRNQFTALDPSVEWRFIQAAADIIERQQAGIEDAAKVDQIRFEKVWALYAQADIVSSSQLRNDAIRSDLMTELTAAKKLLQDPAVDLRFPLAGKLVYDIDELLERLKDDMAPNEEQQVLEFLAFRFQPMFEELAATDKNARRLEQYHADRAVNYIEGISRRNAYERSLRKVTQVVNNVIAAAQVEAQRIVPHYFNKYRTDGIEFTIYAGQSLLQYESFTEIHLQNLRLWQLKTMVDITKAIAGIRGSLLTPMSTAQLILAFGSTIAIQFRMDEKRFDVEGAYNVRYEVIKKRIDKATIQHTGERLTKADHIAIVYSHHSDREVYHELISYLHQTGDVIGQVEDFELEPMQGVDGLSAIRVRVL